jgi:uncharacterized membrane protein YkvA (DUF1232 family)
MAKSLSERLHDIKRDCLALYLACFDARTPFYVKIIALAIATYAFSPVDFIPDFIPVLGLFDDLILVGFAVFVAFKLLPKELVAEFRQKAETAVSKKPLIKTGILIVAGMWIVLGLLIFLAVRHC